MKLDLTSLARAVDSLESALDVTTPERLAAVDDQTRQVLKAGVIQNFEFTYEISHKMLKRHMEMSSADPSGVDAMSFPEIIRGASEQGLVLNGWDVWKEYRQARGSTSHAYDQEKADQILAAVPAFLVEARYLLAQLTRRNFETP